MILQPGYFKVNDHNDHILDNHNKRPNHVDFASNSFSVSHIHHHLQNRDQPYPSPLTFYLKIDNNNSTILNDAGTLKRWTIIASTPSTASAQMTIPFD